MLVVLASHNNYVGSGPVVEQARSHKIGTCMALYIRTTEYVPRFSRMCGSHRCLYSSSLAGSGVFRGTYNLPDSSFAYVFLDLECTEKMAEKKMEPGEHDEHEEVRSSAS